MPSAEFFFFKIKVLKRYFRNTSRVPNGLEPEPWYGSKLFASSMHGTRIFLDGVHFWRFFFYLIFSKYHEKRAIIGPPAKRHLNGVSLACQWWPNIECWLGSFMIIQGILTSIAKKPYIFVIFQAGGEVPDPLPPLPPLDPRMSRWQKSPLTRKGLTRSEIVNVAIIRRY